MSVHNVSTLLAPTANDVAWTIEDDLMINLICRTDSYKFTHPFMFKHLPQVKGMSSYGEARVKPDQTVTMFGMQMLLAKYFSKPITMAHVDAAEAFAIAHFGRNLFARADWEKVVNVYNGFPPIIIRALPEGTTVTGGMPLYSVTCLDEDLFWMSSGFETIILRGVWYPTTIATLDRRTAVELKAYYLNSGADLAMLPFALHDFGGRGVSSAETAEVGGAAHMLSFMGSDTIEGVLAANHYYGEAMSGFSVFATEHSVECSFGLSEEGEGDYIRAMLANATPGSIVSIVIDGKDTIRCAARLCAKEEDGGFREAIIASSAKVVFRPDSGDMFELVPQLLKMQVAAFGSVKNAKGYRKINNVGLLWGDGIDRENLFWLLEIVLGMGLSADNIVFGSGGALLQKVDRDTLKFAQKGSAILIEELIDSGDATIGDVLARRWQGIAKDPITDPGKKSKEGVMTVGRNKITGELKTMRLDKPWDQAYEDAHVVVYHMGQLFNKTTLAQARARAAV